jgi:hypothetical protein
VYAREVVKVGGGVGWEGERGGGGRVECCACYWRAWFAQRIRRWLWLAVVVVSVRV